MTNGAIVLKPEGTQLDRADSTQLKNLITRFTCSIRAYLFALRYTGLQSEMDSTKGLLKK